MWGGRRAEVKMDREDRKKSEGAPRSKMNGSMIDLTSNKRPLRSVTLCPNTVTQIHRLISVDDN